MTKKVSALLLVTLFGVLDLVDCPARAYVLNSNVPSSGGCPQYFHHSLSPNSINRRWVSSFPANKILTSSGFVAGNGTSQQKLEIENAVKVSFDVWTSAGTSLAPGNLQNLVRVDNPTADECNSVDGINAICFNEELNAFSSGVIAFTRVATLLAPSSQAGEITDADILFHPADSSIVLATRLALTNQNYDLESILIHELGHFFGFSHSSVLRAIMYPFAHKGMFLGGESISDRCPSPPIQGQPCDRPLADDDRTGLRILYPNPADTVNVGSIHGRVLPENPLSLKTASQPGFGAVMTGIFGSHVVAIDADTGAVVAGTIGGWSCDQQTGILVFDGGYRVERLPVGTFASPKRYKVMVEPIDGPTSAANISLALQDDQSKTGICRTDVPNPCSVPRDNLGNPVANLNFTTKVKE